MQRASLLLALLEQVVRSMVRDESRKSLSDGEIRAILGEVLRVELARLIELENAEECPDGAEVEARIAELEAENDRLRDAARRRDWAEVAPKLDAAGQALSITLPDPMPADLARSANSLQREVNKVEIAVHDGDDVRSKARGLIAEYADVTPARFLEAPILLSRAIACAVDQAPSRDMANKVRATGEVALQFWGDIPLNAIDTEKVADLFCFISRLPKDHGRKHGNNRYDRSRVMLSKHEEIAAADRTDEKIRTRILTQPGLTLVERRARLGEQLTPRVTEATLEHHLNRLHAILRRAEEHLGWTGKTRFMTCDAMLKRVAASVRAHAESVQIAPEANLDGESIAMRVTAPKTRLPWSSERIATLLSSPIYTGCARPARRWKPGDRIIRDAYYWLPLLMLLLGTRVTEVLQLKQRDVVRRNGVFALRFGSTPDHRVKTEDSVRYVPIPQILLDLGFVTWAYERPDGPLAPLFPNLAEGRTIQAVSVNFMKKLRRVLSHIGIQDFDEDFYALRMTLFTRLASAGISDARRKVIAGHCNGDIINAHYTAHNLAELKAALDSVDYGFGVVRSGRYGFPVIADVADPAAPAVTCDAVLGADGSAEQVIVADAATGQTLLNVQVASSVPCRSRRGRETLSVSEAAARLQQATVGKIVQMSAMHADDPGVRLGFRARSPHHGRCPGRAVHRGRRASRSLPSARR